MIATDPVGIYLLTRTATHLGVALSRACDAADRIREQAIRDALAIVGERCPPPPPINRYADPEAFRAIGDVLELKL